MRGAHRATAARRAEAPAHLRSAAIANSLACSLRVGEPVTSVTLTRPGAPAAGDAHKGMAAGADRGRQRAQRPLSLSRGRLRCAAGQGGRCAEATCRPARRRQFSASPVTRCTGSGSFLDGTCRRAGRPRRRHLAVVVGAHGTDRGNLSMLTECREREGKETHTNRTIATRNVQHKRHHHRRTGRTGGATFGRARNTAVMKLSL